MAGPDTDPLNQDFHCDFLAASTRLSHRSMALLAGSMWHRLYFATRPDLARGFRDTQWGLTPDRRPGAAWCAPRVRGESGG
jgi:hypothetical protein